MFIASFWDEEGWTSSIPGSKPDPGAPRSWREPAAATPGISRQSQNKWIGSRRWVAVWEDVVWDLFFCAQTSLWVFERDPIHIYDYIYIYTYHHSFHNDLSQKRNNSHGGFLSHRGPPSHHPFLWRRNLHVIFTIQLLGVSPWLWKPPYVYFIGNPHEIKHPHDIGGIHMYIHLILPVTISSIINLRSLTWDESRSIHRDSPDLVEPVQKQEEQGRIVAWGLFARERLDTTKMKARLTLW